MCIKEVATSYHTLLCLVGVVVVMVPLRTACNMLPTGEPLVVWVWLWAGLCMGDVWLVREARGGERISSLYLVPRPPAGSDIMVIKIISEHGTYMEC